MLTMNYPLTLENKFVMTITGAEITSDDEMLLQLDKGSTLALSIICGFPVKSATLVVADDYTCYLYAESLYMPSNPTFVDQEGFYEVFPVKTHMEGFGLFNLVKEISG